MQPRHQVSHVRKAHLVHDVMGCDGQVVARQRWHLASRLHALGFFWPRDSVDRRIVMPRVH
jgi:hypothetical protein